MEYLSIRTRGNSTPEKKPRVYFTCHPDDFARYFDTVCEDIFKTQDCAVYYTTDMTAPLPDEYRETDLGSMNLFVVPVTFRLLTEPNRAMDSDIAFALEKHVPILPLMMETGIDEFYAEKFGKLQYLSPYIHDLTAISYEEKLKKYLTSILLDDETAEKVRAAFDAYIFLSYRKKDRQYANELMKLIHANPLYQDIAIWYDEFLTPGESFSDSIEKMLEKSDLFTLLVTPNLVNEENYVKSVEYPAAKQANKKVLPAEMVETDAAELKKQYDGIPDVVKAKDDAALRESLAQAFSEYARRENDDDPMHNYLIGLAYLEGIDVEVNREKAVELITKAAEAELPEAMEKLVSLYKDGVGVERNYFTAIEWQQRLADRYTVIWQASGNTDDALNMEIALCALGDDWRALGKLTEAREAYREMLERLDSIEAPWKRRRVSLSYDRLGYIAQAEGDLPAAREYYEKSLAIFEQLAKESGTIESRCDLSVSYEKLGNISKAEGDLPAAKEYYEKSLATAEQLAEESGTIESRRDLSVSYNKLGNIAQAEGNLPAAKDYYLKGLAIAEQLAEESGTIESRRDLSVSYERLGDISEAEGNLPAAKDYYLKGLAIAEQLAEESGTIESRRDLAISYERLGDIAKAEGNLPAARAYYEKSLAIREQLARESGTIELRRSLSVSYIKLGEIFQVEDDLIDAWLYYEKCLAIDEQLVEENGTIEARRDLAVTYDRLGEISQAEGDLSSAKDYYEKGLAIREQLARESGTIRSRRDLAVSYNYLGEISQAEHNLPATKEYYEKAIVICEQLAQGSGTIDVRHGLSIYYGNLGNIFKTEGNLPIAKEYYQKSLAIREQLAEECGTVSSYDDLANSYVKISFVVNRWKRKRYLKQAYSIWKKLSELCPDVYEYHRRCDIVKNMLENRG